MAVLRKCARPLLASVFLSGGLSTLRDPKRVAAAAEPVAVPLGSRIPRLTEDPERLVRINGAVQVGAGVMLATGRLPRAAALALAGSLVPTTLAGHAWWKEEDPERRAAQRTQFIKNLSLLGGLLLAAADTHGKPSVAYRSRTAAKSGASRSRAAAKSGASRGRSAAKAGRHAVRHTRRDATGALSGAVKSLR
ncbi:MULTISPECIES: DoxX family membrane protein [unclassified Streptomyces]|uniref:DoxX family membrane protein n=1 Tax=unclassified Streptomyces TaxID=2593676 RepID=UPI0033DCA41A